GARMVVVVAADSAFSDAMAEVEAGSPADSMSDDNGQADDVALLERDGDRSDRASSGSLLDDGDASNPAASRSADAPAPGVPHRVETGETWSRILVRYRLTEGELAAANPDVDPNRLEVG